MASSFHFDVVQPIIVHTELKTKFKFQGHVEIQCISLHVSHILGLYSKEINSTSSLTWNPHYTQPWLNFTFGGMGSILYKHVLVGSSLLSQFRWSITSPNFLSVLSRWGHLNWYLWEGLEVWTGPFRGENGVHKQLTFKFSEDQAGDTF